MAEPDLDRARHAYRLIRIFPGIDAHTLREMLDISNGAMQSTLMTCDTNGMLVCEGDDGSLTVYDKREVCDVYSNSRPN